MNKKIVALGLLLKAVGIGLHLVFSTNSGRIIVLPYQELRISMVILGFVVLVIGLSLKEGENKT